MYATPSAIATGLPRCTLAPDGRSGHLTGDIRFGARLAPHPNFAPFSRKTSYIPNVIGNN